MERTAHIPPNVQPGTDRTAVVDRAGSLHRENAAREAPTLRPAHEEGRGGRNDCVWLAVRLSRLLERDVSGLDIGASRSQARFPGAARYAGYLLFLEPREESTSHLAVVDTDSPEVGRMFSVRVHAEVADDAELSP